MMLSEDLPPTIMKSYSSEVEPIFIFLGSKLETILNKVQVQERGVE
jgi:hypothetical protein